MAVGQGLSEVSDTHKQLWTGLFPRVWRARKVNGREEEERGGGVHLDGITFFEPFC